MTVEAMSQDQPAAPPAEMTPDQLAFRGLLWREWLIARQYVVAFTSIWAICLFVIQLFYHPGWLLGFGVLAGVWLAQHVVADEVAEGSEEFSLSLPPTRAERIQVKLLLISLPLAAWVVLGLVAQALNLPPRLWGLVVESGWTVPFLSAPVWIYVLSFCIPAATFAGTCAGAAVARSRPAAGGAWLLGLVYGAAVMGAGFILESLIWEHLNGYVSCPLLLAAAVLALYFAYESYRRKEAVNRPGTVGGGGLLVALVVGLVLLILLAGLFFFRIERNAHDMPERTIERTRTMPADTPAPAAAPTPNGEEF